MTAEGLSANNLTKEELLVVDKFRESKKRGHAEGVWKIYDGKLVQIDVTEKTKVF